MARGGTFRRVGSHPVGVWVVKHIVSPLDRLVVKWSRGRLQPPSSIAVPTLVLTTVGRRSGDDRSVPLVFVLCGDGYAVGNARPAGERRNPWVFNLRAAGSGRIKVGGKTINITAREPDNAELERLWMELGAVWPAFQAHYAATGERTVFVLEPVAGPRTVE